MANPDRLETFELVDEFRTALDDCDRLYRSSAQDVVHSQPELTKEAGRDFVHRMVDLHRGLLLKIFVEVAFVERQWSEEALELAEELFWHLYHKRLNRNQVLEALDHYLQQT